MELSNRYADVWRIELCVDCVQADANGADAETSPDWTGFLPYWQGWEFAALSSILCADECHDCEVCREADDHAEGHFVRPGFPCEGCGSTLGGDRWDYYAEDCRPQPPA